MKEIRKDIQEYEGFYQISNLGRVKSLARKTFANVNNFTVKEDKIMKLTVNIFGYITIQLANGTKKLHFVHRLIAAAFISNPENKPFVNHIDGVKANNNIENLEWVTKSENELHAYKTGLKVGKTNMKGVINENHYKSKKVVQSDLEGNKIKEWPSLMQVYRELNFHHANVGSCARGQMKTAYGFKWSYN